MLLHLLPLMEDKLLFSLMAIKNEKGASISSNAEGYDPGRPTIVLPQMHS